VCESLVRPKLRLDQILKDGAVLSRRGDPSWRQWRAGEVEGC
jgi:hypothetical protein